MYTNLVAVNYIVKKNIKGVIIECGVAEGGSIASMAHMAMALGEVRPIHLYDTFNGLPPADASIDSVAATKWNGKINFTTSYVANVLDKFDIPIQSIHYHIGEIPKDSPIHEVPCEIAVLRLDTDWYASYTWELRFMYPRVVPGGVVIFDDYYDWPGAKKAVQEWYRHLLSLSRDSTITFFKSVNGEVSFCKPGENYAAAHCPFHEKSGYFRFDVLN
jgi:hypothetical protein